MVDRLTYPSPEVELLVCCARTQMDAAHRDRLIGLLKQPLDWNALLYLAKRHGLLPLLNRNISDYALGAVPLQQLASMQADRKAKQLAERIQNRLLFVENKQLTESPLAFWLYVLSRERLRDRMSSLFNLFAGPAVHR